MDAARGVTCGRLTAKPCILRIECPESDVQCSSRFADTVLLAAGIVRACRCTGGWRAKRNMHHHACLQVQTLCLSRLDLPLRLKFPCPMVASAMSSAGGGFRQTEHIDALLPVRSPLFFSPGPFSLNSQPLFIRRNPFHCEESPSFQLLLFRFSSVTHTLNFIMNIQAITFETLAAVSC